MNQSDVLDIPPIELDPFVLNTKETIERFKLLWVLLWNKENQFNWSSNFILNIQDDNQRKNLCNLLNCKSLPSHQTSYYSEDKTRELKMLGRKRDRLLQQDEELFKCEMHYEEAIEEIELDRDSRLKMVSVRTKHERELKKIKEKHQKKILEIKDISDKIRRLTTNL